MPVPINDTFQVRINGQMVDCIRADAFSREVEKNSYSIFFCNYATIQNLINLKTVYDEADNSSLWVSVGSGNCQNADGTYVAFSAYDVLYTEKVADDKWTTINIANLITGSSTGISSTKIYSSLDDVYNLERVPKGAMIMIVDKDGHLSIYAKKTDNTGTTTREDWESVSSSGSSINSYLDLLDRPTIFYGIKAVNETDDDAIVRIVAPKQAAYNDIVILKTTSDGTAVGDEYNVSTYIYDGSKYVAATGNIDFEKIIITKDFVLDGEWDNVGNIKKADKTFTATGLTLYELLDKIFNAVIDPTIKSAPTIAITSTAKGSYEVGSTVAQKFTLSITDGKYICAGKEENMNAFIDSYVVEYKGSGAEVTGEPANITTEDRTDGKLVSESVSGSFILPPNYKKRFEAHAVVKTNKGATNNKGTVTNVKYDPTTNSIEISGQTYSYTHTAVSDYLSSFYMGYFYGAVNRVLTTAQLTSAIIRGLIKSNSPFPSSKTTKNFTVVNGNAQLLVAVPAGSLVPALYNNTVNSPFDIYLLGTIPVQGADESADFAREYDVYAYNPAIPFSTTNSVTVTINA